MNSERSNFIGKIQDSAEKVARVYFDPKPWESEKIYKAVGVRQFQAILKKSKDYGLKEIDNKNPKKELRFGYIAESIHTLGLVPSIYALSLGVHEGNPLLAAGATIPTLMNIYPVFSQRYNRMRIQRVMEKYKRREERLGANWKNAGVRNDNSDSI